MRITQLGDFGYYYVLSKWRERQIRKESPLSFFERHTNYGSRAVYPAPEMSEILSGLITGGKPFMAGRFGGVELSAMKTFDFELSGRYAKNLEQMRTCAGFFPGTEAMGEAFKDLMIRCIPEADVIGVWGQPFEDFYLKRFGSGQLKTVYLSEFEPWSCAAHPWSASLEGRKVLVIHPFAETIKKQYEKREKLFPGTKILPRFDLMTLKAVQTIAGERDDRFDDWFQALEWMRREALKKDFDIAVIGCGAYGFPLAAKLKQAGRQAVHLGGATQILFGIKGKRWETDPSFAYIRKYFNDDWVYPDESERPERASEVEGGCYW